MPSPWSLLNWPRVRPSHISSQPVSDYPFPHDKLSIHPLPARATSSLPHRPLPHHVGSQVRAGGQTCQSKHRRHAAIPQTPITTAGARPGNRMATTWSNQGTQQQGPEKAKKSKCVCVCACARKRVPRNHVQVIKN